MQNNHWEFIRVFSKFIPKKKSEITNAILYTMDINYSENSFKDIAVGAQEFKNTDSEWKDSNEGKLILVLIEASLYF